MEEPWLPQPETTTGAHSVPPPTKHRSQHAQNTPNTTKNAPKSTVTSIKEAKGKEMACKRVRRVCLKPMQPPRAQPPCRAPSLALRALPLIDVISIYPTLR